jgi:hypothetical protein
VDAEAAVIDGGVLMDVSLLAPNGRGCESLALGVGQKLGAPRVKRRLQPDM